MKKIKWIVVLCLFVLSACVINDYWKLRIEIPRKSELDLKQYSQIIVTPFLVEEKTEDFDLNKEIVDYLVNEFKRKSVSTIQASGHAVDKKDLFTNADYWKGLDSGSEGTLYITGSAEYSKEVRKALIKKGRKRYEDPFPDPAQLEQRKFYNLNLNLYFIEAKTGLPVYKREFKESKSYTNPNQTSYNAFFDLALQVKEKLFRTVFGESRLEERYLIIKEQE
jgi:hypothetical protein